VKKAKSALVPSRELVVYDLLSPGNRFLDVGCGDGNLVRLAKSKFKETYGVDLHARATSRLIHFIECDVEHRLPFFDACFDSVTCVDVLRYLVNPSKLLNEIGRVLKIGGELIVQTPNFAWLPYRIQLLFGKIPIAGHTYGLTNYHIFTKSSLCRLLDSRGFEVDHVLCSGKLKRIRRFGMSILSSDIVAKCHKTGRRTYDLLVEILYGKV
jgi:methionine biosynthesis protein MetW